jgi:hypothetical protein
MVLLLLGACARGPVEEAQYEGDWDVPQRSDLDDLDLPPGPDGTGYTLIEGTHGPIWADLETADPVTGAGECAALLMACVDPGQRNIRGCLENVRPCETDSPWTEAEYCCPSDCADRYVTLRGAGYAEPEAVTLAIWGDESCAVGLDDFMAGEEG